MSNDVVRFGIAGLGMGHNRAKIASQTEGAQLVCVCDIIEDKAKTVGEELHCEWCTEYEDMLARDDMDVVGVMLPSGMHADAAIQAVEAGKHTYTTKPMDIRVEKCDALIAAAEQAGVILAVDFDSRYNPANHQLRMGVRSGKTGKILFGDLRMKWWREQSYYDGGSPAGWRSRKETEGGSIANQGVHFVDLLQWFIGPVKSVYGRMGTLAHNIQTEDATMAMLTFESGAWGLIHTTTANYPSLGTAIEISGENGTLLWKDNKVTMWQCKDDPEASLERYEVDPDLPHNIIEDMITAITKGRKVAVDGHEGRKSVAIFNAVYESARTGKVVNL